MGVLVAKWRPEYTPPPRAPRSTRRTMPSACSRGRDASADDRLLDDRQVGERGEQRERHVRVPHPGVAAGVDQRDAAEPRAEEGAGLMREQRQAEQRGEIARAEQL